jgi:hypothetical protein
MNIEITPEVLVKQLGMGDSAHEIEQMQRVINNTEGFEKFASHIISLSDSLKHLNAYIALSNTVDKLKIKCDENDAKELLEEFHEKVTAWGQKYKVKLEKVYNKETYYILGHE